VVGVPDVRTAVGRYGEDVAVRHLLALGCELVDRNWRCPAGEIDVVVRDGATLVVCEVKTRRSLTFGAPMEAVDRAKAARLRRLTGLYLAAHEMRGVPVRIDLVGVLLPSRGAPQVEHLRGVG
jgi:putative endonuclease